MGDIPGWLKSFRTPTVPQTSSFEIKEHDNASGGVRDGEDDIQRLRNTFAGSSFIHLGRRKTPSTTSFNYMATQMTQAQEVWHNPDDTQIIESLHAVLMNQPIQTPIPVEYNSSVMQLLAAYGRMHTALLKKNYDYQVLEEKYLEASREFEKRNLLWSTKEIDYKQEIKRLEVTLARGERGLEFLTIARSNSVIYKPEIRSQSDTSNDSVRHYQGASMGTGGMYHDMAIGSEELLLTTLLFP
jgi:hypothetical protein